MATTAPPDSSTKLLAALTAAVEKHAKLELLASQLPERLAQARAEVEEAYRQLGLVPPSRGGSAGGRAARGEVKEAVLFALPGTRSQIAEATGVAVNTVGATLTRLRKDGLIVTTGEPGNLVFHRAGEEPDDA